MGAKATRIAAADAGNGKTTLCSWVKAICRALDAAGCDSAVLLAEAGLDAKSLDGPTARCPVTYSLRLWKIALARQAILLSASRWRVIFGRPVSTP